MAGVGGFFRVVYGRGEGGGQVSDSVLFDLDEGRETFSVDLRHDCDQVGEKATAVVEAYAAITWLTLLP